MSKERLEIMVYAFNVHEYGVLNWNNYVKYGFLSNVDFLVSRVSLPNPNLTIDTEIYAYIGKRNSPSKIGYVGHGKIKSDAEPANVYIMKDPALNSAIGSFLPSLISKPPRPGCAPLHFIGVEWLKIYKSPLVCSQNKHHFPKSHICEEFDQKKTEA